MTCDTLDVTHDKWQLGGSDPFLKKYILDNKKTPPQKFFECTDGDVFFLFFFILQKIILEGVLNCYDEGKPKFSAL